MGVYQQEPAAAGTVAAESGMRGVVVSVSRNEVYSFTKPTRGEITLIAGLGVVGDVHAGITVKHRSRVAADPTQPNLRQVHLIHAELHDEVRSQGYEVPAGGLGENITTAGLDLLGLPVGTILRFGPPPAGEDSTATTADPPDGVAVPAGGSRGVAVPAGPVGGAAAVVAAAAAASTEAVIDAVMAILAARIEAENPAGHPAGSRAVGEGGPGPAVIIAGLRNPCLQINGYQAGLLKQVLGRDSRGNLIRKAGVMAVVLHGGTIRPGDQISVDLPDSPHLPLDRV